MTKALAQLTHDRGGAKAPPPPPPAAARPGGKMRGPLTGTQKAAVIVRLLLAEGSPLPLAALPDHMQAALTEQIALMHSVNRETLRATVEEFLEQLEGIGLSFPGGIDGALSMLDGHISATAANRLRRIAGSRGEPWARIAAMEIDALLPVIEEESPEVGAVVLSKLPVPKAAALLGRLSGERARRVAFAVSLTGNVDPDTVRRIGYSLATQLEARPPRAFDDDPGARVGAILNVSPALTRDEVLKGLEQDDRSFAESVRRAIFTFEHIPVRLTPRDVPKVVRIVDQGALITALAGATGPLAPVADFLLDSLSQRMADGLREEIAARGHVREKDAEAAMGAVVAAIRALEAQGEIALTQEEEEDGG